MANLRLRDRPIHQIYNHVVPNLNTTIGRTVPTIKKSTLIACDAIRLPSTDARCKYNVVRISPCRARIPLFLLNFTLATISPRACRRWRAFLFSLGSISNTLPFGDEMLLHSKTLLLTLPHSAQKFFCPAPEPTHSCDRRPTISKQPPLL